MPYALFLLFLGDETKDYTHLTACIMKCGAVRKFSIEPLMRKRFSFFETVISIHLNLCQLRSVGEVYKDLNMSSGLSADRVKCQPESIKSSY